MEIILCMAHIELEEKIRRVLSQELIYKAGKLIDLHPDSINKVMDIQKFLKLDVAYLIIVEVDENSSIWKECRKLQEQFHNIRFILVGSEAKKCVEAVKTHIHLIDYFDINEEKIAESIVQTIITLAKKNECILGGIFLKKDDEYRLVPLSEIKYIETIKRAHKSIVRCRNNNYYYTRKTIRDLERCLGIEFMQCRANVIINVSYIKEINIKEKTITLDNGYVCFYSKNKVNRIKALVQKNAL